MLNVPSVLSRSNFCVPRVLVMLFGVALIFVAVSTGLADSKTKSDPLLKLKTERVIVFKDGYSLIVKRGSAVTDEKSEIYIDEVPDAAVLGSFWAVPKEGRMRSMVAGWKTVSEKVNTPTDCKQNIEILHANQGKACKVELSDKTVHSGTIQKVLLDDSTSAVTASYFILRTGEGDVLLPVSQVRTISIHEMKTAFERTVTNQKRTKRLTFRFEKPNVRRELLVMYFRPGIRWIPTYRVQLSDDQKKKTATMTLQAEILNEAEDLLDVPIDLVVGVPNFRFRDMPSPLVLESTLRNALKQAAPSLSNQFGNGKFSNSLFTQQVAQVRAPVAQQREASIKLPGELTGAGTQDLFIYHLEKLDFRKGERAAVQIFTADVPFRSVYTWDLHVKRRDIEAAPSGAGLKSPLVISENKVWHQIELTNNTKVPWTTGAAMIMQDYQPLGQELLTYTPPKSAVRIPVTVSVDTRGSFSEEEITRKLQAITWDHHHYAKIDKKATLLLHNYKEIPIETEITVRFGGKFDEISDEGIGSLNAFNKTDWQDYRGSSAVNNSSTIRWRTTIEPGKAFEPTVKYHYYTRH